MVQQAFGSIDIMVAHQVLERLKRPLAALTSFNSLLKNGGRLILSTPFLLQDHRASSHDTINDHFRYTVPTLGLMVQCAGIKLDVLEGRGNALSAIAYLLGLAYPEVPSTDLFSRCNALKAPGSIDRIACHNKAVSQVFLSGTKMKATTLRETEECFYKEKDAYLYSS